MASCEIQVKPMAAFETDVRREAARVFVDGYYKELSFLSKDRDKLAEAWAGMMNPDVFYLALMEGEVVGILACSDRHGRALAMNAKILRDHFGFIKGSLSCFFMKDEFNTPVDYPEDTAYIECVATAEKARRKGVSTALFRHLLEHAPYRRYVLDVADTNTGAYRLYKKLGFAELYRLPESFAWIKGFKERIFMDWKREMPADWA